MTEDEYRKKHKSCNTCRYFCFLAPGKKFVCKLKNKTFRINRGKFCGMYKAKEWRE